VQVKATLEAMRHLGAYLGLVALLHAGLARPAGAQPELPPDGPEAPAKSPAEERTSPQEEVASAPPDGVERITLAESPIVDRQTLESLLKSEAWPRRALAAIRLERFDCGDTQRMLVNLLRDESWQVRTFAVRSLGRRGIVQDDDSDWFSEESEPRVVRALLRNRYVIAPERLSRGVRTLSRSNDLEELMLAVELALPSGDAELVALAEVLLRKVVLRMGRTDAGALSPRLAAVTGQADMRRHVLWQQWLRRAGKLDSLHAAYAVPEGRVRLPRSMLAAMDGERFSALERYIGELAPRRVDLALVLDTTASMWSEITEAQGSMDDLMLFAGDVVRELRVGLVVYRDRRDEFEAKFWDFTSSIPEARQRLWNLTADGGGDYRESVNKGLLAAFTQLSWNPQHSRVLILIGDAPPHVGVGSHCVEYAARGKAAGVTTHVIQADEEPVKFFGEIAAAGGGKAVTIDKNASLVAEITGLSLGDKFDAELREFFSVYLELCR